MDYTLRERWSKTVVSFGFAIPGVFEFGFNYSESKYSKSVQKIRRASGQVRLTFPPFHYTLDSDLELNWKQSGNLQLPPSDRLPRPTVLWEPKQSWSWLSTCWSQRIWCFTLSSWGACAPCLRLMFMGNTDRSTETMAPITLQRLHSVESMSTPSS